MLDPCKIPLSTNAAIAIYVMSNRFTAFETIITTRLTPKGADPSSLVVIKGGFQKYQKSHHQEQWFCLGLRIE
jgi:hypothetical protein